MSLVPAAFFCLLLRLAETSWSPTVGLKQLDEVEGSLRKIAKGYTKWSPSLLTFAKHVSEDVHRVVSEVEAKGSSLTQEDKAHKIAGAVWELEELKRTMQKAAGINEQSLEKTVARSHKLKASLEKQLQEKKVELQHLLAEKRQEEDAEVKEIADQHDQSDIVAKLVTYVTNSSSSNQSEIAAAAPRVIQALEKRAETLSLALKSLDAEEQKAVAHHRQERKAMGFGSIKAQMNLATVWKHQQKRYHKVVSVKKSEMDDIKIAVKSIQDGDWATLQKTTKKMKRAARASEARGGHFLHFLQ